MPRTIFLAGIGEVTLTKRRRGRNLRLSVSTNGQVRLSLPLWVPYSSGVNFVQKNLPWLSQQVEQSRPVLLQDQSEIGRYHRLLFIQTVSPLKARVGRQTIAIFTDSPISEATVQQKARQACEKALLNEARDMLPARLEQLALAHDYHFSNLSIRKMSSRWGSCSSGNKITLNSYLVQLPDYLIDYVLVHELVHTKHKNHSQQFWDELEARLAGSKQLRAELKTWQPRLLPRPLTSDNKTGSIDT